MKQVATAIPYGLCKMFLDETEDSSRLIKVANGACCFHQVRIDYEAMLLKKFWKCYKQCDHTRKITLGWSALPKLDEDGGMYVENLSNNQSITGSLIPLPQFLSKVLLDWRAAIYMIYEIVAFYSLAEDIHYTSNFYPSHWLVDPTNLRLVICDLAPLYYIPLFDKNSSLSSILEDLRDTFLANMVPVGDSDDEFAESAKLILDITSSKSFDRICNILQKKLCQHKAGYIQINGAWSQRTFEVTKAPAPHTFAYCIEDTRMAILSEMAILEEGEVDECAYQKVIVLGYGITPPDLPKALARENGICLHQSSESSASVSTSKLVTNLYQFPEEFNTYGAYLIIWTNRPPPNLRKTSRPEMSFGRLAAELNSSNTAYVLTTNHELAYKWQTYFGRSHVIVVNTERLSEDAIKFFRDKLGWQTLAEWGESPPSNIQYLRQYSYERNDCLGHDLWRQWTEHTRAGRERLTYLETQPFNWLWNHGEKEGISHE